MTKQIIFIVFRSVSGRSKTMCIAYQKCRVWDTYTLCLWISW